MTAALKLVGEVEATPRARRLADLSTAPAGCGPTPTSGDNPPVVAGGRLPVEGSCIGCDGPADGIVRGQIGDVTGSLCADCAYWCDGNVVTPPESRPREGSIEWCRRWFDRRIRRGALVEVDGRAAHVLSARKGFLYVRVWKSGERVRVRPYEVSFPN